MGVRWIVGDIHGMALALKGLVDGVSKSDPAAEWIFVGDYVNRGPDSRGVIDFLLKLANARFCRGNHDDVFDVLLTIKPMVMVLLGGLGTIAGPAIGAFILLAFEELVWRNFLTIHAAALGLIIVALVLFLPNGLLTLVRQHLARSVAAK